jgi:hypothetical protein
MALQIFSSKTWDEDFPRAWSFEEVVTNCLSKRSSKQRALKRGKKVMGPYVKT